MKANNHFLKRNSQIVLYFFLLLSYQFSGYFPSKKTKECETIVEKDEGTRRRKPDPVTELMKD
jgi:hypothetical protein